jgi:hypothetical protein
MAALWTEDNTIGNALSQAFGNSGARGPAMYKQGIETRILLDQQQAAEDYIRAQAARIKAEQPPPYMPPSATGIPWEGPPTPEMQTERNNFELKRNAALSAMTLGARNPANMLTIAKGTAANEGFTDLSLYGVPSDPNARLKQDVQMRGSYPDSAVDPNRNNLTPALAQTRMRTYEEKVARGIRTDEAEDRQYASDVDFVNPIKSKVGESQTSFARDQLLSPAQQAALARANPRAAVQTAQATAPPPAPLQPAAVSGPGSLTVTPDAPRPPPKPGDIIDGYQFINGDYRDQNNWRPAPPQAAATPAVAAPAAAATSGGRTITGPDGQPIVVQSTGDPKTSTEALAKNARAVDRVEGLRLQLEKTVGLQRDQNGTPIGITGKYVPGRMASTVSRTVGDTEFGQAAAQMLDEQGRAPGESKMQEYAILTNQWIEEVVRLVSGATVLPAERSSYRAMYMPNASDTDENIKMKFELMRNWAQASAQASTPAEAIAMMRQAVGGNPTLRAQIDAMEAKAAQARTLNVPYQQLRAEQ